MNRIEPVYYGSQPEEPERCTAPPGRVLMGEHVILEMRGLHSWLYEQGLQMRERDLKDSKQRAGGKNRRRKR